MDWFKVEESLAKATSHQAAMGNNGTDHQQSRFPTSRTGTCSCTPWSAASRTCPWPPTWIPCCRSLNIMYEYADKFFIGIIFYQCILLNKQILIFYKFAKVFIIIS
jgi:hypothetical protein